MHCAGSCPVGKGHPPYLTKHQNVQKCAKSPFAVECRMPPANASFSTLLTGYTTAETLRQMAWLQCSNLKGKKCQQSFSCIKSACRKKAGWLVRSCTGWTRPCSLARSHQALGLRRRLRQWFRCRQNRFCLLVSEKFLELQQMRPPRQLHQSDRDRGLESSDT